MVRFPLQNRAIRFAPPLRIPNIGARRMRGGSHRSRPHFFLPGAECPLNLGGRFDKFYVFPVRGAGNEGA